MLEGEIGTGKTALWKAAAARSQARGYRVLTSHPGEAEASLTFASLGDLLEGTLDVAAARLPDPQDRALRVALLMLDPDGPPPDERSVSVATLNLLRSLAERSPVILAIDDLQWMDRPTARVLEFVLRRLRDERIGAIAAVRSGDPTAITNLLDRSTSERELHRLAVSPLDPGAIDELLRTRLGADFVRPLVVEISAASGGNPLFALELARGILRGDAKPKPGEPLSVPGSLQQLVLDRLADVPADARELLFVAAAVSDPAIALLERTAPRPAGVRAALEVAAAAGVVEIVDDRVRFTHPLFASTLYHALESDRRRTLHRSLAGLVANPSERARHLALGAEGPDAAVAAALDEAARAAIARGAPDAAADLSEQAQQLTPDDDVMARDRRRVEAADYHFAAGDLTRARRILEEMAAALEFGPVRASILRRLATVRYRSDSCAVAAQLLTRALSEVGDDVQLRAGIERDLAWAIGLCGDLRDAAEHANSALQLVEASADGEMLAELLAATGFGAFALGHGVPTETMQRAIALERPRPEVPIEWRPTMVLGMMLKWAGELDGARRHFDELHRRTREAGEETSLPFLLSQLSETASWEGNWATALQQAEEAHTMALQAGQQPIRGGVLYARALSEAHLGLVEEARASAQAGFELSQRAGSVIAMMLNQAVRGFIELSLDDPAAANGYLAPLIAWSDVVGLREPGMLRFVPDQVEALIALGELDKAEGLLGVYEADAARLDRTWALLAAARCRALHSAAAGDAAAAADSLRLAVRDYAAVVPPFERGRALLVLGTIERRTRRRKAARASLEDAAQIFAALGAQTWSDKTLRLLGRSENRVEGDLMAALTPAEREVARLVASGATNREAAHRLFVSVRAVEVHLTSIYRKLGIRSRTQLARQMARRPDATRPKRVTRKRRSVQR